MMSEVKRYGHISYLVEARPQMMKLYPEMTVYVLAADFDRLTAERESLQQHLNAADQRIDELTTQHQGAPTVCACGDSYPAKSYGAGFMAANGGVCENCDAVALTEGMP